MLIEKIVRNLNINDSGNFLHKSVTVYGRVIGKKIFKKHYFIVIRDKSFETIQIINLKNQKVPSVGSIVKVVGVIEKSPASKPIINSKLVKVLNISENPNIFFQTQNPSSVYSSEFHDLVVFKSRLYFLIRNFFIKRGFLEIETPILNKNRETAIVKPFVVRSSHTGKNLYLRITSELSHKQIASSLLSDSFEIGKVFRNMGPSKDHIHEYTVLEVYKMFKDYRHLMKMLIKLFFFLSQDKTIGKYFKEFQVIKTVSLKEFSIQNLANDNGCFSKEKAKKLITSYGFSEKQFFDEHENLEEASVINFLFQKYLKKHTDQPTFYYDFPSKFSPLSRRSSNNKFAQEFEFVYKDSGIAHGYNNIYDASEQKETMVAQIKGLKNNNENKLNENYLKALEVGLPPMSSLCIGLDRLTFLLLGYNNIKEAIILASN